MKLTEWFPEDVKPIREGVYLRKYPEGDCWCRWFGGKWRMGFFAECRDAFRLANLEVCESIYHRLPWRGLAKKP